MTPFYQSDFATIYNADALAVARELPDESIDCCVTSPPYWGLRDYGVLGQIGIEPTPDEYVARLVEIFREVRRAMKDTGTLWVNLGDCYSNIGKRGGESGSKNSHSKDGGLPRTRRGKDCDPKRGDAATHSIKGRAVVGLKPKDLIGIPWLVAFALRADGWYLRGDHVWGKPNGMPESVKDRPTRGHEYVFILSKSPRYFYDDKAVRTAPKASTITRLAQDVENQLGSIRANGGAKTNGNMKAVARKSDKQRGHFRRHAGFNDRWDQMEREEQMCDGANLRSVWWIPTAQCRYSHFAVMPERVAQICILAGCPGGGIVFDPFIGTGTTGRVAIAQHRRFIGSELSDEHCRYAADHMAQGMLPLGMEEEVVEA